MSGPVKDVHGVVEEPARSPPRRGSSSASGLTVRDAVYDRGCAVMYAGPGPGATREEICEIFRLAAP